MNNQVFLTLLLIGLGSAQDEPACPTIFAKPANECQGQISECWSPGSIDYDCDNGAGVCCFDGCVNVCGKPEVQPTTESVPTCETVTEIKYENVTKEMCQLVEQPPSCTTRFEEDCTNFCETVQEVVPTQVESNTCNTEFEKVCEDISSTVCTFPEIASEKCPVIFAKPVEECSNEPPSDCWSPTVPDVDCPSAGLCCFNGCYNRCLKPAAVCHNVETQVCTPFEEEECTDVPSNECQDFPMNVKVPVVTKTCTHQEKACTSMFGKVCDETRTQCEEADVEKCIEGSEEVCQESTSEKDAVVVFNKCQMVTKQECKTVTKDDCKIVSEEVCPDCVNQTINNTRCSEVPKEVCQTNVETVNKIVPKEVCTKTCTPREEKDCVPVDPQNVCNTVVRTMSFPVPVLRCG